MLKSWVMIFLVATSLTLKAQETVYLSAEEFIAQHFQRSPSSQYFWLTRPHKAVVSQILGHKPSKLRVRYWGQGSRTLWIMDEIGKERPITVGIAIDNNKIVDLQVLVYRESRGHEVKQRFFTNQYLGSGLKENLELENQIDGITGATLSVRALNKLARVALYLHQHSPYAGYHETTVASP